MDYQEARAAFFSPREGEAPPLAWTTPARRLRDAMEPIATICFWSEPAYAAYAAVGLDFLQGYVWGRGSALGEAEPGVAAAAFGVFEPGLVADLFRSGRATCSLADVRRARLDGAVEALEEVLGAPDGLDETVAVLQRGAAAADPRGRALHAGLAGLDQPGTPLGRLWHTTSLLREHRGDTHLAVLVASEVDGVQANVLTELWVGWDLLSYTGSRAWAPEAMDRAVSGLQDRGLVDGSTLSDEGRRFREQIEATTDRLLEPVVAALGDDLEPTLARLATWSDAIVARGWFPPDPFKRASG